MSPFFEHGSSAKAARAVMILSATIVVLQDCTSDFSSIGFLGLNVGFENTDVVQILWYSLIIYAAILALRIYSDAPGSIFKERRSLKMEELSSRKVYFQELQKKFGRSMHPASKGFEPIQSVEARNLATQHRDKIAERVALAETTFYLIGRVFAPLVFVAAALSPGAVGRNICYATSISGV